MLNSSKKLYINEIQHQDFRFSKLKNLRKGTKCIKNQLSKASKDVQKPFVLMFFPLFGAYLSSAKFQYPGLIWQELCGKWLIWWPKVGVISATCPIL